MYKWYKCSNGTFCCVISGTHEQSTCVRVRSTARSMQKRCKCCSASIFCPRGPFQVLRPLGYAHGYAGCLMHRPQIRKNKWDGIIFRHAAHVRRRCFALCISPSPTSMSSAKFNLPPSTHAHTTTQWRFLPEEGLPLQCSTYVVVEHILRRESTEIFLLLFMHMERIRPEVSGIAVRVADKRIDWVHSEGDKLDSLFLAVWRARGSCEA